MLPSDSLELVRGALDVRLFELGGASITVASLIAVAVVAALTFGVSLLLQRAARRLLSRGGMQNEGTVATVTSLVNYAVLLLGFGVALQTVGIDLGALFAAGALFAVGLGFAMQNIAQNFVAGVILLAERSIRPGDIVEVEGLTVRVLRLGIRATVVRSRDGEDLIVPNSLLAQNPVKNYTLHDSRCRVRTVVGVVYASEMARVRRVLETVAAAQEWRDAQEPAQVLMLRFADSAVEFEVAVWITDPWGSRRALSRLNEAIWDAFRSEGITIAFPQLDVHLDAPVVEAMRGARAA